MKRVVVCLMSFLMFANAALAALPDEYTVYTDDIAPPGETEVEFHLNTTPSGITTPAYPGEVVAAHGWRLTPEISYGLNPDWAVGLYLPAVWSGGVAYAAGARAKLTWVPLKAEDYASGYFLGLSSEISSIRYRFEPTNTVVLMLIAGREAGAWLFALNPAWSWSRSQIGQPAEGSLAMRLVRTVDDNWKAGAEYYSAMGQATATLPFNQQSNILFAVMDYESKPYKLNIGIGRGVTSASDKWTIKSIFELPF